jgi:hypothetical protein
VPEVKVERVLAVGGEGGELVLYQEVGGSGRFRVAMTDQALTFLAEDDRGPVIKKDSGWLPTWKDAIAYYSKWPWPRLTPLYVSREFAGRVREALRAFCAKRELAMTTSGEQRWREALGILFLRI